MQAVASAVASVCLRPQGVAPSTETGRPAGPRAAANAPEADAADVDLSTLIGQVRSKRAARRNAKKARRRAAKQEAQQSPPVPEQLEGDDLASKLVDGSAADQGPEAGGASGAASALVLPRPPDGADSPMPPSGTPAETMPPDASMVSSVAAVDAAVVADSKSIVSSASSHTLRPPPSVESSHTLRPPPSVESCRTLGRGSYASASHMRTDTGAQCRRDPPKVSKRRSCEQGGGNPAPPRR